MKCQDLQELLDIYMDGQLNEHDRSQVDDHLSQCPFCRELYEEAAEYFRQCQALRDVELPQEFHSRLHEALMKEEMSKKVSKKVSWKVFGAAAAALLILAVSIQMWPIATQKYSYDSGNGSSSGMLNSVSPAIPPSEMQKADMVGSEEELNRAEVAEAEEMPQEPQAADSSMTSTGNDGTTHEANGIAGNRSTFSQTTAQLQGLVDRKIIRSAYISLESQAFDRDLNTITGKVLGQGGYIESSNIQGVQKDGSGRTAHLELRVPKQVFDQFITDVSEIGRLLNISQSGEDITGQYFDVEGRLKTLQIQQERLQNILAKAEKLSDIITLENEISRVQNEIESLTGTLKKWDNMVDYSKIIVDIYEVKELQQNVVHEPTLLNRIQAAFLESMKELQNFGEGTIIFVIRFLPYALILSALGIIVKMVYSKTKRSVKKEKEGNMNE